MAVCTSAAPLANRAVGLDSVCRRRFDINELCKGMAFQLLHHKAVANIAYCRIGNEINLAVNSADTEALGRDIGYFKCDNIVFHLLKTQLSFALSALGLVAISKNGEITLRTRITA